MVLTLFFRSGKKIEYTSIPYESIRAFSAESAGAWDRDSEVDLYTRNLWTMGKVRLDFRKGKADIIAIQKFLSAILLDNMEEAGQYLNSKTPIVFTPNVAGMDSFMSWITNNSSAVDTAVLDSQLHSDPPILLDEERVSRAFRQGRDMFVYTDRRVILMDVQGLSGKKIEYKSTPWKWVKGFEFETAGNFDRDAELYLHVDIPAHGDVKQSILVKSYDIYEMHKFVYDRLLF